MEFKFLPCAVKNIKNKNKKQAGPRNMTKCSSGDKDLKLLLMTLGRDSYIAFKAIPPRRCRIGTFSRLYLHKKCTNGTEVQQEKSQWIISAVAKS